MAVIKDPGPIDMITVDLSGTRFMFMENARRMLKERGHSNPEAYEMSAEEAKLQKELQDVLVALSFLGDAQGLTDSQSNLMITVSSEIGRLRV